MKVKVLGKQNMKGTSKKSGSPYDLNFISVSYRQNGVEGEAVDTVVLDPKTHPLASIVVGKAYDLDRDGRGFVIGFDPA